MLLSLQASKSDWVQEEIDHAKKQKFLHIIPVLIKGKDNGTFFGFTSKHWIDMRRPALYSSGIEKLLSDIRSIAKEEKVETGLGQKGNVRPLESDISVFKEGIEYFEKNSAHDLLIYAPTGVWEVEHTWKEMWFWTIAYCLANNNPRGEEFKTELNEYRRIRIEKSAPSHKALWESITPPTGKLHSFTGIYGIPPRPDKSSPESGSSDEKTETKDMLDYMERILTVFNDIESAKLYYLETNTTTVPGTGILVIDTALLFVGFAVDQRYRVDYGFMLTDRPDIIGSVGKWFTGLKNRIVNKNIIQEIDAIHRMTIKKGMRNIRKLYKEST